MHLIIGLAILGLIIMMALFLARVAITLIVGIIMLFVAGVSALFNKAHKGE